MEQKNKNVRLIGLDLDGTTLTSEKVLTPHTKEVLEKCLAEGIQCPSSDRQSENRYSRVFNTD